MAKYTLAENIQRVKASLQERFEAGKQAMRDDFFGSKTDWSYFNTGGCNTNIVNQLNYNDTRNATSMTGFNSNAKGNLLSFPIIDTSKVTTFSNMFGYCDVLTEIPQLDTSNGTDFSYMFSYCRALTKIPQLDTSNGTDFSDMFASCEKLPQVPEVDTSNGTNFSRMFYYCTKLTEIPQLDTSKGTNFQNMFFFCSALTKIPIIDTSNGTLFSGMFQGCSSITEIPQLDLTKATSGLNALFHNNDKLTTINIVGTINISDFNVTKCPKLNIASLRSIKDALADKSNDTSKVWKVVFGSTLLAKFSAEELEEITQKGWLYQ